MASFSQYVRSSVIGWTRNLIYLSAVTIALPWLCRRRVKTGRYQAGLEQKLRGLSRLMLASTTAEGDDSAAASAPLVWLHGVSVGEVQLLKPLLTRWQTRHPDWRFALSTTTDSGMELARKTLGDDALLFYFPLDFTWSITRTLNSLKPAALVLGELELWPNLIDSCVLQRIPVAVVNGRLSPRSFTRYQKMRWLTQGMFSKLSLVAAQSESNAERFRQCGAERTTVVTGSIKFDNVSFDRQAPDVARLRQWAGILPKHRVWIMGSTQAGEELPAVRAYQQLCHQFPELKLIVVPRHPDRFEHVAEDIERCGVRMRRRSTALEPLNGDDWDVLLVDSVGELKWWWGLAEIAVVGGSFGARGGQNMLEPAAYGANVAFGPNTSNFRDTVELLLAGDAAVRLESLADLSDWLTHQLLEPQLGQARGERAQAIIASGAGALDRTLDALDALPMRHVAPRR
ncbi:MAG: 3-deoxy-D-manno-octulosonic acid transferase [Aureliella sp.]